MAPRTEKPQASPSSADAEGKTNERQRAARTRDVGQAAVADSDPRSAVGQSDPVPPRAKNSGTEIVTAAPDQDPNDPANQVNPNKDKPTEMSNLSQAQSGTGNKLGYLPNQALVAPSETSFGEQVAMLATPNQPYGSEPSLVDTESGKTVQPPPVQEKAESTEQGGKDADLDA